MASKKDKKDSLIETSIYCIIGGAFISALYPPFAPISYMLNASGVAGLAYYGWTWSKYNKIFKNLDLGIGIAYPIFKSKHKTDYSTIYKFTLPCGLSLTDFLDKKEAIEQYVGKDIDIKYTYKEIYIEEYNEKLKSNYHYSPIKIKGDVPIIIGYDRRGELITCDLSDGEPHMLIAGETGSGKSTIIRSIITNILLTTNIKLHLIDLKMGVEFSVFSKSKQVISFSRNISEAKKILQELCIEVERRSNLFYSVGVTGIKGYNSKFKDTKIDYQILIIDEFADLQYNKDGLSLIEELGRKARSCGIHVIIATQRPDSKVVTGGIKVNIGNVLGLKTLNGTNSSIIIDETGLEKLHGNGHGKFKRGGKITEIQCPYLDIEQCKELIKHTYINKAFMLNEKITTDDELLQVIENF
jgi:S-DNA-T family DNA segregation ATPase FtsK/SpoIIIE